jgi:predicted phage baseplate assembly protein
MPLKPPDLDTRRFDDLVAEARSRIPRYTPEWTNFNDSDPGMTLVKLHAWMTETILFQLNRVPDLNYIAFLNLIGLEPRPARPARVELAFTLDKLDKPSDTLVVYLPLGVKVAVDDPNLTQEVVFETDASATAVNAAVAAVIAREPDPTGTPRQLVTIYDDKAGAPVWAHSFDPFGPVPEAGAVLYVALVLRPLLAQDPDRYTEDRFPDGPLDLYVDTVQVFDTDPEGATVAGPVAMQCPDPGTPETPGAVEWQVFTGSPEQGELFDAPKTAGGWTVLNVTHDSTLGFARSGHVALEMPKEAAAISPRAIPEEPFWQSFGQPKPPATLDELKSALADPDLVLLPGLEEKDWKAMGLSESDLEAVLACGEDVTDVIAALDGSAPQPDPAAVTAARWAEIEPRLAVPLPTAKGAFRRLYWIRALLTAVPGGPLATVRELRLNTVPATQAATRLDERLGRSNGRPGQVFTLQKKPVLIDPLTGAPDLELALTDANGTTVWTRVASLFGAGPASAVYLLDPTAGTVTFGDGSTGQIPVADTQVVVSRYRYGGGTIGNVAPGTITAIKGRVAGVKAVTNPRPAADGSDAETLDEAKLRAPHDLRTRDRAVSGEDFAYLARETPGAAIHKAYALPRRVPTESGFAEKDGAVTLVVLPANDQETPQPSEAQLRAVGAFLEPRRLVTTELHVTGPRYTPIGSLSARLTVLPGYDLRAVGDAATAALTGFLNPLTGGADGTGWPFGEDIFHADLYDRLLAIDGVRRVSALDLTLLDQADTDPLADVTALPEGHLPYLPRASIALDVRYD